MNDPILTVVDSTIDAIECLDFAFIPESEELQADDVGLGVVGEFEDASADPMIAGVFEAPSLHERLALARLIGERMRSARELCNLSQSAAAKRLGYANPSKLSKVEAATDTNSVPLWLIRKAAEVYEVSVDYLFGVTDDWETGARMTQERQVSAWLFKAWDAARFRDVVALQLQERKPAAIYQFVVASVTSPNDASAALARFAELNPGFATDMRGSNRLAVTVEGVASRAATAYSEMVKAGYIQPRAPVTQVPLSTSAPGMPLEVRMQQPDAGQDVRDRGIAHIATGGYARA